MQLFGFITMLLQWISQLMIRLLKVAVLLCLKWVVYNGYFCLVLQQQACVVD